MFLVSSWSCLCPIHRSQVLRWEWRYSWNSADRRCLNYIWVILLHTKPRILLGTQTHFKAYRVHNSWNIQYHLRPLLLTRIISVWVDNYMPCKVWNEITYPFPNFKGATAEVRGWTSNFTLNFCWKCDNFSMFGLKLIHISEGGTGKTVSSLKLCCLYCPSNRNIYF